MCCIYLGLLGGERVARKEFVNWRGGNITIFPQEKSYLLRMSMIRQLETYSSMLRTSSAPIGPEFEWSGIVWVHRGLRVGSRCVVRGPGPFGMTGDVTERTRKGPIEPGPEVFRLRPKAPGDSKLTRVGHVGGAWLGKAPTWHRLQVMEGIQRGEVMEGIELFGQIL